jgi:hypothetical protein
MILKEVYEKYKYLEEFNEAHLGSTIYELLAAIKAEVEKSTGFEVVEECPGIQINQEGCGECTGIKCGDTGTITRPLTQTEINERYILAIFQSQYNIEFCKTTNKQNNEGKCPCSKMTTCIDYLITHIKNNTIRRVKY